MSPGMSTPHVNLGSDFDAIVIGAGAAGLFFAGEAGRLGARVCVLDHAKKIGEKIRISGGGRCNFTNLNTGPEHFLSENPKFCISALRGFSPYDFLDRVNAAGIAWHEKALGQLFCDRSATQITDMLLHAARDGGADIRHPCAVEAVTKDGDSFVVATADGPVRAAKLVIATGGKSIPKIGATGFGYDLARQFGLPIVEPRAGLVPLTFSGDVKQMAQDLAGVSVAASVSVASGNGPTNAKANGAKPARKGGKNPSAPSFEDGFLFTHRGLSGPSILQISSYWREGQGVRVNLCPGDDVFDRLKSARTAKAKTEIQTVLADLFPKRLAQALCTHNDWHGKLAEWSDAKFAQVADSLTAWTVTPSGSEGYRTAEVTLGGVSTDALNSKTMEAKSVPGLFFIGEVVDVTGWLGGYNFQWAWASAHAAARA